MLLFMNSAWLGKQLIIRSNQQESVEMGEKCVRYKQYRQLLHFYAPYVLVHLYQGEELCYVETKGTIHSTIRVAMQPTARFWLLVLDYSAHTGIDWEMNTAAHWIHVYTVHREGDGPREECDSCACPEISWWMTRCYYTSRKHSLIRSLQANRNAWYFQRVCCRSKIDCRFYQLQRSSFPCRQHSPAPPQLPPRGYHLVIQWSITVPMFVLTSV
jgi:hypothetical protein